MNREIKFRIWDKNKAKFRIFTVSPPYQAKQCTGLKDSEGSDIYEGDTISVGPTDYAHKQNVEVQYSNGGFECIVVDVNGDKEVWSLYTCIKQSPNVTIIGNVFENPELLTANE